LPSAGHGHAFIDSFHGFVEVAHEVAAAEFTVGENFETQLFLPFDDSQDVLVLKRAQLCAADILAARLQ